jgi:hypothetical protein
MKTTLTVIGPPSSEENSFFVPEQDLFFVLG